MRVLIAYRSRYGATQSCAQFLADRVSAETVLHDLRLPGRPSPADFDVILVGGSIYGGKIQREIGSFCDQERERLLSKKVGLFICSFYDGERGMAELQGSFPPWLSAHAFARELFGGKLSVGKLSVLDRFLAKAVVHPPHDIFAIRTEAIERMAEAVNALKASA
ncbi:MAG: flavodoxin domain-containing protein [Spirochaetia bacterium]